MLALAQSCTVSVYDVAVQLARHIKVGNAFLGYVGVHDAYVVAPPISSTFREIWVQFEPHPVTPSGRPRNLPRVMLERPSVVVRCSGSAVTVDVRMDTGVGHITGSRSWALTNVEQVKLKLSRKLPVTVVDPIVAWLREA
jgi:hypothetical protein